MEDCTYDCDFASIAITDNKLGVEKIFITLCNRFEDTPTTNAVSQLSLGGCQGQVTHEPLIPISPTSNFSESFYFTESEDITKSSHFDPTEKFTRSNEFTISEIPINPAAGNVKE